MKYQVTHNFLVTVVSKVIVEADSVAEAKQHFSELNEAFQNALATVTSPIRVVDEIVHNEWYDVEEVSRVEIE